MFSNNSSLLGEERTQPGTIAPRGSPEYASLANDGSGQDIPQPLDTPEEDIQTQTSYRPRSGKLGRIAYARPLSVIQEES
jgi:hypothetical protein